MIYKGTDLKFQVTTTQSDFSLAENDFTIRIRNRWGRVEKIITKNDCFYDKDGRFYFMVENVKTGVFYAFFSGSYEDDDYDKQTRTFTDEQALYEVGQFHCARNRKTDCGCDHKVHYTMVETVSVDGADYLADSEGRYIYTSDGKRIQFTSDTSKKVEDMGKIKMNMTGEEFLKKWEGIDTNGEIDTVPEMLNAMRGISDNETVVEKVEEQVEETDVERVTPEDLAGFEV